MTSQVFIFCCFVYRQLYGTFQRLFPESKRWLVRSTSKSMEAFASQRGPGTRESWRTSWASPLDVLRKPKKMPKTVKPQFFWIIFADYFQVFRFFRNVFWGWNSSAVRTSGSRLSHSAVPAPSLLKEAGGNPQIVIFFCCLKMCTLQALQGWKYQAFGDWMIDFRKNWHDIFVFSCLFLVKYEIIQSIHHLNPKLLGTWVCLLELVLSSCLCVVSRVSVVKSAVYLFRPSFGLFENRLPQMPWSMFIIIFLGSWCVSRREGMIHIITILILLPFFHSHPFPTWNAPVAAILWYRFQTPRCVDIQGSGELYSNLWSCVDVSPIKRTPTPSKNQPFEQWLRSTPVAWWLVWGLYYPKNLGDYDHPRTGNAEKHQPGFSGIIEGFWTFLNNDHPIIIFSIFWNLRILWFLVVQDLNFHWKRRSWRPLRTWGVVLRLTTLVSHANGDGDSMWWWWFFTS